MSKEIKNYGRSVAHLPEGRFPGMKISGMK